MISGALKENEVLVDYFKIHTSHYVSAINSKGKVTWKYMLFTNFFFEDLYSKDTKEKIEKMYNQNRFYGTLIEPVYEDIKDKNIIICPAGILGKISFNFIKLPTGKLLGDSLEEIISSPSVLFKKKKEIKFEASLFGGVIYDIDNSKNNKNIISLYLKELKKSGDTNHFIFLPESEKEIDNISKLFTPSKVTIYKGKNASRENFMRLNGNSKNILLLSTHGFYFPIKGVASLASFKNVPSIKNRNHFINNLPKEDLYRSGLALANANKIWENTTEENKGLLFASEVSKLNLSNTNLVVLSACQTAIGDINNTDGLFGFQKGFKLAGVEYIVGSLWPVPDKETSQLMFLFFKYLKQTKEPNSALKMAQLNLKKQGKSVYQYGGFVVIR